eukprot:5063739-Pyramimonas_sp.AAC.1
MRAILRPLGAILRPSWSHRKRKGSKKGAPLTVSPKVAFLRVIWALLGAPGEALRPPWAPHRALLGHLGAILRLRGAIGSEKARKPNH